MTWGTFLFIVILYGKFVNMAYLLTYPVCIFAHFRIDEFGIYLCGQNGLMPQHFLQSFQWHPFEDGQNGEGVTSDMRGDFGMAIALFADNSEAEKHRIVFAYRENTIGGVFLFVRISVLFNQFDGYGQ